jgi:hypothetical protein
MTEMTNKGWALAPTGIRQRLSNPAASNRGSGQPILRLEADDGVRTESREELSTKSVKTWFWIGALIIIVALGFILWPLRRFYLRMKEKHNGRWKRAVL